MSNYERVASSACRGRASCTSTSKPLIAGGRKIWSATRWFVQTRRYAFPKAGIHDRHLTTIWRSSVREAACGLVWTGGPSVERRARSSTLRLSYLCSRSSFDRKSTAWRENRVTFFQRPYTYIKTRNFVSAWIDRKAKDQFLIDFLGNRIRANQATCRIWSDTRMISSRNSFTSTVVSAACGRSGIGDTRTGYFEIVLMTLSCKNWGRLIRSRIRRLSYEKSTRLEPRSEGNTKRCEIRKRWSRILGYDTDLRYGTTIF